MAVDPNIKKKADDIRNKVYGKEVRESLASGLEAMSTDVIENEGRQSVVEGRQDSVESQWQDVSDEMTDKDVISAPEIITARNGEPNLKERLDKEHETVTSQLAHIAINVKEYGAKGDGVTDDTLNIQKVINEAISNGVGKIFFPAGTYMINSLVDVDYGKNLEFFGEGNDSIIKVGQTITNSAIITFRECSNVIIRDLFIDGSDLIARPLRVYESNNFTIKRVGYDNFKRQATNDTQGLLLVSFNNTNFINISDIQTTYGVAGINGCRHVYIQNIVADSRVHTDREIQEFIDFNSCKYVYIDNCYGRGFKEEMFDLGAVSDVYITNTTAIDCEAGVLMKTEPFRDGFDGSIYNIILDNFHALNCGLPLHINGTAPVDTVVENIKIINSKFTTPVDSTDPTLRIGITRANAKISQNIVIENCYFEGANNAIHCVSNSKIDDFIIKDNIIEGGNFGFSIATTGNVVIENNSFTNTKERAIYLIADGSDFSLNSRIKNNLFKNCATEATRVINIYAVGSNVKNLFVEGNTIDDDSGQTKQAIMTSGVDVAYILNNIFPKEQTISTSATKNIRQNNSDGVETNFYSDRNVRYAKVIKDGLDNDYGITVSEGVISILVDSDEQQLILNYEPFKNSRYPVVNITKYHLGNFQYNIIPRGIAQNGQVRLRIFDENYSLLDPAEVTRMMFDVQIVK